MTDDLIEAMARAIYDAPDEFSGDFIAEALGSATYIDDASANADELRQNVMRVCRSAARAALAVVREREAEPLRRALADMVEDGDETDRNSAMALLGWGAGHWSNRERPDPPPPEAE